MRAGLLGLVMAATALVAAPALAAIDVVATTTDLAALVSVVGGSLVTVESIVPPGADPEAFEPRPGDLAKLRSAELVVRVGLGYDYWLDTLVRQTGEKRLMRGGDAYLDASAGIPLLEIRGQTVVNEGGHAHGVANPHYWLDPENAITITAAVVEALVRVAPAERAAIVANRQRFLGELETQRARWENTLAPFAGVKLIAYHNSWPYFARRFRLDVTGFIEPRAGVAPTPAHLAQLIAAGRKASVRAIVHEPHEPEDASRFVAQKLGVPVIRLATSVRSLAGTDDYLALLDYNVATLAKALATRSP